MKKKLLNVFKIGVSFALVFLLFRKLDWGLIFDEIQNVSIPYIFLFVVLQLVAMMLSAKKWQTIAQFQDISFTLWEGFKTYLTGTFINNFLPATIGGDIYRSLWLS